MDFIFLRNETLVFPNPHNLAKIPKNYLRTGVILNKWVRVVEPHLKSDESVLIIYLVRYIQMWPVSSEMKLWSPPTHTSWPKYQKATSGQVLS